MHSKKYVEIFLLKFIKKLYIFFIDVMLNIFEFQVYVVEPFIVSQVRIIDYCRS